MAIWNIITFSLLESCCSLYSCLYHMRDATRISREQTRPIRKWWKSAVHNILSWKRRTMIENRKALSWIRMNVLIMCQALPPTDLPLYNAPIFILYICLRIEHPWTRPRCPICILIRYKLATNKGREQSSCFKSFGLSVSPQHHGVITEHARFKSMGLCI